MNAIDSYLNRTTMYRLTLYVLIGLLISAGLFAVLGFMPFSLLSLLFSILLLSIAAWATNMVFAYCFEVPANTESFWISALILALILSPPSSMDDALNLFWAVVLTMASKYIFALHNKHLFNPVAFAVSITALVLGFAPSWWVGSRIMLPLVLLGGFLIVKKLRRADLPLSFLAVSGLVVASSSVVKGDYWVGSLGHLIFDSPWIFFATVMLTEPLTTPPTGIYRILYGAFTGLLFAPQFHVFSWYPSPENALVIANLFSYAVSPKEKLMLKLKEKIEVAPNLYDFVFEKNRQVHYLPGQYMEWTLGLNRADSRGNRRYFTLASSPTEPDIRIGVRFYDRPSRFKQTLLAIEPGHTLLAGQTAGDFTLPDNVKTRLVFIAGGIGITPFRSMVKFLLDTNTARDITLMYSNKTAEEILYTDIFDQARQRLGLKTVYTLTDPHGVPPNWAGAVGRIDEQSIVSTVPDYKEARFYISGPNAFVTSIESILHRLGIPRAHIVTDYFPGY